MTIFKKAITLSSTKRTVAAVVQKTQAAQGYILAAEQLFDTARESLGDLIDTKNVERDRLQFEVVELSAAHAHLEDGYESEAIDILQSHS